MNATEIKIRFLHYMKSFGVTAFEPDPAFPYLSVENLAIKRKSKIIFFFDHGLQWNFLYKWNEETEEMDFEHESTHTYPLSAFDRLTPDQQAAFKRAEAINDKIFELYDLLEEMNFDTGSRQKIHESISILEKVRVLNLPKRHEN